MLRIDIMHSGDEVLTVTPEFIAVRRKNGEVDLVPIVRDETGCRVDTESIVTIGFGNNTVTSEPEPGVELINF